MRVVHVSLVRPRGRPDPEQLLRDWPTLAEVAAAVQAAGAEVTVVQSFHRDAELSADGVRYRFVAEPALPGRPTGLSPWRIARAVQACRPEVIHVHGLDFGWHARILCGIGVPVLVQDHAGAEGRPSWRRRWGLWKAAGVAFTDAAQAELFKARGCLRRDIPVFAVAESSTRFSPGDQAEARARTGVRGDPAVLWVGRLDANKDPLTILRAVELAADDVPGLRLWCCFHEQPLLAQVQARIAASPVLSDRVRLLGRVDHAGVEALCRAADVFMLGSHHESTGYALIEALACGLTPVVSDIPSFRKLTGEGRVGALAAAGDAAAFARALVTVASCPRDGLRAEAVAHFRACLSFEVLAAQLLAAYAELAGGRQ